MVKYYHTTGVIFSGNEENPMVLKKSTEQGIGPSTLMGITNMQDRASPIKEVLDKSHLQLNEPGFFELIGDKYISVGFNL